MKSLAGLVLLAASGAAQACFLESAERLEIDNSTEMFLRFAAERPRVGAHFQLELLLCRAQQAFTPARLSVEATMPEHAHGMNYRPEILAREPGRFTVVGLLFHMPGLWRLRFDIEENGEQRRAELDYRL